MRVLMVAVLAAAWSISAVAQAPGEGGVTAMGMATIKRSPEVLRVQVQLTAEGKTVKDALAKLAVRREACRKKFVGLGVKAEAVTFEDARVEGADPRQQQMEMMARARRGGGGRPPATGPAGAGAAAPPQKVAVLVKAEWPLEAKTAEELLIAGAELQAKIKAADVGETKTASLEEQEAREEMAGMMNDGGEQAAPPGEPVFLYVAKISDEERGKAMAEAFGKAKASAAELAKAAGVGLGGLRQVTSQTAADVDQMQMMRYGRYNPYMYAQMSGADPSTAGNEAMAAQPGPVTMRVTVSASFGVK